MENINRPARAARWTLTLGAVALLLMTGGDRALFAEQPTLSRVVLQDLPSSIKGYHTVSARVTFPPGSSAGKHTHPGDEAGYVLEGTTELLIDGQPPRTLKVGDAFLIPAGVPHDGRNVSQASAALLSVYTVLDGQPLATPVK